MSSPLVSIVLLTRNAGEGLATTIEHIQRQRTDFEFEIIAIDSGSTDGTLARIEAAARQLVRIPPETFDHGLTRNAGVERASGEFVVFLVQDACPSSDEWLARLIAPLRADARVAGAFCRQQPRPDATLLTRRYLESWIAASPMPRRVTLENADEFGRLTPYARFELCAFDNVCSCIRRSVWERFPFSATPIAEDVEWGRTVLLAGYTLHYVADAVVTHSHDRSTRYEFARTYVLHRRLQELFGLRTIPTVGSLARAMMGSIVLHLKIERQALLERGRRAGLGRALGLAVAWPLGQYLGGLAAVRGWKSRRFAPV